MLFASLFQKASQPSAARAVQGYDFPPLWDPSNGSFFIFSPSWGPPKLGTFKQPRRRRPEKLSKRHFAPLSTKSSKSIQILCFLKCVCMFLQCFPSKHGNLHMCHHKSVPKHNFLTFFTMFPIPLSPQTLENSAIYTVFFNFSMWPMPLANSNIHTKNHSKTLFY